MFLWLTQFAKMPAHSGEEPHGMNEHFAVSSIVTSYSILGMPSKPEIS